MNVDIFKEKLKPKFSIKTLENPQKTAELIADAYEKATINISSTIYGSKLISADKSVLADNLKKGLELNSRITKKNPNTVEPGWLIMAMGFYLYWNSAKFTPMPPMPPATNPAPVKDTGTILIFPGNPKKLAENIKKIFITQDLEFLINNLSKILYSHLATITGVYVGIIAGTPPVPLNPIPWTGLFDKPKQKVDGKPIIDSKLTFEQALQNISVPEDIKKTLVLLDIQYISSDDKLHIGQIMVSKDVQNDVKEFFKILLEEKFPINKMIPVVKYDWDDEKSMEDNNTSGFNYRVIANSDKMSKHSFGSAIDVNPKWNPVIYRDGKILPKGAYRDESAPGTLTDDNKAVKYLKSKGWNWGGDYKSFKDWHHFDKDIDSNETKSNVVPTSDYTYAEINPATVTVDIGIPKIKNNIQSGFQLLNIPQWQQRGFKWSFANLTLYEPSGKATGVFVKQGRITNPITEYPYYTMKSETTGGSFFRYVTIAILKNNTIKMYETDYDVRRNIIQSAEDKVLRELKFIKFAFSGTDLLIRDGGPIEERAVRILDDDKSRPKTSVGFHGNKLYVAVTTAKTSQNWIKWGNTLREINENATWISMDGGGSSTMVIKGIKKQVAEGVDGRKISTIIGWYEV